MPDQKYRLVHTPKDFFTHRVERRCGWFEHVVFFPHWHLVRETDYPANFERIAREDAFARRPPNPPEPTIYLTIQEP